MDRDMTLMIRDMTGRLVPYGSSRKNMSIFINKIMTLMVKGHDPYVQGT